MLKKKFYALLKTALWNDELVETMSFDSEEMPSLFALAKKQAVAGLISHALVHNNIVLDDYHAMLSMGLQRKIANKNAKNITDLVALASFMQRNAMPMVVVKGQTLGALYPIPQLRQSGDIDFFCGTANFVKARQLMADKLKVKFAQGIPVKHLEFKIDDTQYELHRILSIFSCPKTQKRFNEIMENGLSQRDYVTIGGGEVPVLPPTEHLLFQTTHVFYHIYKEGVGLRQLCDMAVFIFNKHDETDFAQLHKWLKELHLKHVFEAIVSLLIVKLGLKVDNASPLLRFFDVRRTEEKLSILSEWIWQDVEEGGNFGVDNQDKRISTILKHYIKYVYFAPTEILYIPYEKLSRRYRGLRDK